MDMCHSTSSKVLRRLWEDKQIRRKKTRIWQQQEKQIGVMKVTIEADAEKCKCMDGRWQFKTDLEKDVHSNIVFRKNIFPL